jgi:hypothetical protein
MKKLFKLFLSIVLSFVILFFLIVIRFYGIKIVDTTQQSKRLKELRSFYESETFSANDDQEFADFDLTDDDLKLNEIKMLASHNSYKKNSTALGRFFVKLGSSAEEADSLNYSYKTLTQQFRAGIRSMEFDLRLRKTQFTLTHVPLVDNSSVAPDFSMALEEIELYSRYNPNHVPIIILIEIKDDWMILDHALQKIDQEKLIILNTLIKEKLGDTLFQPKDMILENMTLKETITDFSWPSLSSLRGKVIMVLHPGGFTDDYVDIDPTLFDLAMFPGVYSDQVSRDYSAFVVENNPESAQIPLLVSQNFIVRTRIDSDLYFSTELMQAALLSGAQILTSDYTIARSDLSVTQMIYLATDKTIVLRTI